MKQFQLAVTFQAEADKFLSHAETHRGEAMGVQEKIEDSTSRLRVLQSKLEVQNTRNKRYSMTVSNETKDKIILQRAFYSTELEKLENNRTACLQLADQHSRLGKHFHVSVQPPSFCL